LSTLVDFHAHLFSRAFFEALAAQSPAKGSPDERIERACRRAGIDAPSRSLADHVQRWNAELDRYGVAHMVSFASLPEEVDALVEAAAMADGRITPFALVNPLAPEAGERTRALFERGFRGVLLFPALHRFDPGGPEAARVLGVVNAHAGFAVVHCGVLAVKLRDLFELPRPYDLAFANPLALIPAANAHRDALFVIPHFGAGFLRETLMVGSMCANVHVDTSSSNAWMKTQPGGIALVEVFERALDVFGPERILFGTDSSTFPRGWRHDLHLAQREALGAVGTSGADIERVMGGNAARLLGL
jgi:predicted TIM-barrel fold metal-dependent hydrolase